MFRKKIKMFRFGMYLLEKNLKDGKGGVYDKINEICSGRV